MKHKTATLEGALLDAAVALADGGGFDPHRPAKDMQLLLADGRRVLAGPQGDATKQHEWSPSTRWDIGGPIIEQECIRVEAWDWRLADSPKAHAWVAGVKSAFAPMYPGGVSRGRTPLIAAMRAFVASKLGEEVELP